VCVCVCVCIKDEEFLKVTGSDVHCKSGNIFEAVLDRDAVTTRH